MVQAVYFCTKTCCTETSTHHVHIYNYNIIYSNVCDSHCVILFESVCLYLDILIEKNSNSVFHFTHFILPQLFLLSEIELQCHRTDKRKRKTKITPQPASHHDTVLKTLIVFRLEFYLHD